MAVVSYGKQNMNRVKICEIMELVGILRKKRMKKAPLPKITRACWCKLVGG